jgi:hypothetical protein
VQHIITAQTMQCDKNREREREEARRGNTGGKGFQSPARYDRLRALTTYCADHVREKLVEKFLKNAPPSQSFARRTPEA